MKELHLSLKNKWYQMIQSGYKKEEYREINAYWIKRLINNINKLDATHYAENADNLKRDLSVGVVTFKDFDSVHFTLGYPKKEDTSRHMLKKIKEIVIDAGNIEWGASEGKEYFVIRFDNLN